MEDQANERRSLYRGQQMESFNPGNAVAFHPLGAPERWRFLTQMSALQSLTSVTPPVVRTITSMRCNKTSKHLDVWYHQTWWMLRSSCPSPKRTILSQPVTLVQALGRDSLLSVFWPSRTSDRFFDNFWIKLTFWFFVLLFHAFLHSSIYIVPHHHKSSLNP